MTLYNRLTGERATPEQEAAITASAKSILNSPYSAPEQVEWALDVLPGDEIELWFWESVQAQAIRNRRQHQGE